MAAAGDGESVPAGISAAEAVSPGHGGDIKTTGSESFAPSRCITRLKRQDQNQSFSQQPEDRIIRAEELEAVRRGLQELEEELLAPLVLRYFMDLNSSEIGEILALNPNTVRSRLREGRLKLAQQLKAKGLEE